MLLRITTNIKEAEKEALGHGTYGSYDSGL
jgi:hypothetical protein